MEEQWYDHQIKRILEQKCSPNTVLLIPIPVLNYM